MSHRICTRLCWALFCCGYIFRGFALYPSICLVIFLHDTGTITWVSLISLKDIRINKPIPSHYKTHQSTNMQIYINERSRIYYKIWVYVVLRWRYCSRFDLFCGINDRVRSLYNTFNFLQNTLQINKYLRAWCLLWVQCTTHVWSCNC